MPPLYLFEDSQTDRLYPLTYARATCELRAGCLTLLERLQKNLGAPLAGIFVRASLAETVRRHIQGIPVNPALSTKDGLILINARLFLPANSPHQLPWKDSLAALNPDSAGLAQSTIAWAHISPQLAGEVDFSKLHEARTLESLLPRLERHTAHATLINRPWDLLDLQRPAILEDFAALGPANHATLFPGAHLLAPENIHLAKGVKIWPGAVLDAQNGPIIIEADTEIRAGAVVTGPTCIGPHCIIRTHADIRENCSIGPDCRVGGEVVNSVFLGNSNKQHYGFLGQSIVGEWVNLGAGTSASNLKNTYGTVRITFAGNDEDSGRQFLGAIIADHVKTGLGTKLSTGTVLGFGSHIILARPPRFVPSFAWLTGNGVERADFEKIEQIATIAMSRRNIPFTPADHELFIRIAQEAVLTENYSWPT